MCHFTEQSTSSGGLTILFIMIHIHDSRKTETKSECLRSLMAENIKTKINLSPAMAMFMKRHNYKDEERFISLVSNWHKSSDGRGLSEEQRHTYNISMLHYLLEDWLPWYWYNCDYSTADIN
ncbi:hypothetical protein QZH41_013952, partial [Actinostola sp. cb2023]